MEPPVFCPNCGKLSNGEKFCTSCGKLLSTEDPFSHRQQNVVPQESVQRTALRPWTAYLPYVALVVLGIALALAFMLSSYNAHQEYEEKSSKAEETSAVDDFFLYDNPDDPILGNWKLVGYLTEGGDILEIPSARVTVRFNPDLFYTLRYSTAGSNDEFTYESIFVPRDDGGYTINGDDMYFIGKVTYSPDLEEDTLILESDGLSEDVFWLLFVKW